MVRCQVVQVQELNPKHRGIRTVAEIAEDKHGEELNGQEIVIPLRHIHHIGKDREDWRAIEESQLRPHHRHRQKSRSNGQGFHQRRTHQAVPIPRDFCILESTLRS